MKKLVIATHNPAKLKEIAKILNTFLPQVKLLSLRDCHIDSEPEETGETFEENAKLKAQFYANLTNLQTLSDDGGLEIDQLNGEPGVKSNRWLGRKATDKELVDYTLQRLNGIPEKNRSARFIAVLYAVNPMIHKSFQSKASIEGHIALKPYIPIPHGYPYRSLFVVNTLHKYYAELTEQEHALINHRYQALKQLSEKLKTWYN